MQRRGPLSHCNRALAGATVSIVRDRRAPPAGGPMNTRMVAVGLSSALAFLLDRSSGTVTRVSVSSSGTEGNGESTPAGVSADGQVVVFFSGATNLTAEGQIGLFVRDLAAATTTRIGPFYFAVAGLSADG